MEYTSRSPLPRLRRDIARIPIAPTIVALYDDQLLAERMVHVTSDTMKLLEMLDGVSSAEQIAGEAARRGLPISVEGFLDAVGKLDRAHFMESPRLKARRLAYDREYNGFAVRPAAFAGRSYPKDPRKLRATFDRFLENGADVPEEEPTAVIAPHIDFTVGGASYGPAYNALRRSTADTFVIFGVAHQMSYDTFMISEKDFDTPLGAVPTDREFIERYRGNLSFDLTRNEAAHRWEHSIEFQAVFLRHIFPDRDIRIVPILTGSLYRYVEEREGKAAADPKLTELYETLERTATELGRRVCYIAGADLCHIGKKFGDDVPAHDLLPEVHEFDLKALDCTVRTDAEAFLETVAAERNRYRVCGVAPIYATLRTARAARGELLCYDHWDETERNSAVTFASVALYR